MKKIMFNDECGLTQAVLEGRKRQTRRLVPKKILDMIESYRDLYYQGALEVISVEDAIYNIAYPERMAKAPYKVGEEVAIAQCYKDIPSIAETNYADVDWKRMVENKPFGQWGCANKLPGWNNKMFVRADLMPHRIKFTDVRVEKLQNIDARDCILEGIDIIGGPDDDVISFTYTGAKRTWNIVGEAFADLIDKVSGKGTWESNPYVFAYDFELIR